MANGWNANQALTHRIARPVENEINESILPASIRRAPLLKQTGAKEVQIRIRRHDSTVDRRRQIR